MAKDEDIVIVKEKLKDIIRLNKILEDNEEYHDYCWDWHLSTKKEPEEYTISIEDFEENILKNDSNYKFQYQNFIAQIKEYAPYLLDNDDEFFDEDYEDEDEEDGEENFEKSDFFDEEDDEDEEDSLNHQKGVKFLEKLEKYKKVKRQEFIKNVRKAYVEYDKAREEMHEKEYSESLFKEYESFLSDENLLYADKLLSYLENNEANTLNEAIVLLEKNKVKNKPLKQQLKEISEIVEKLDELEADYNDRKTYNCLDDEDKKIFYSDYVCKKAKDDIPLMGLLDDKEQKENEIEENKDNLYKLKQENRKKSVSEHVSLIELKDKIFCIVCFIISIISLILSCRAIGDIYNNGTGFAGMLWILVFIFSFGYAIMFFKEIINDLKKQKEEKDTEIKNDNKNKSEYEYLLKAKEELNKSLQKIEDKIATRIFTKYTKEWLLNTENVIEDYENYSRELKEYDGIMPPFYMHYAREILRILEDERASNLSGAMTILDKDLDEKEFKNKILKEEKNRTKMLNQEIKERKEEERRHNKKLEEQAYLQTQEMKKQSEYAREQNKIAKEQAKKSEKIN